MAQACDGYTRGTLMGNWYEEREAPTQPFRENLEDKQLREKDYSIALAADNNQLKPLPRIKRNQPWVTQGVIPDDGLREFRSNQSTGIDPISLKNYYGLNDMRNLIKTQGERIVYPENSQNHIQIRQPTEYKMINKDNFREILQNRQVTQNEIGKHVSDFGSTFRKHEQTHEKFFDQTSYQASFKKPSHQTDQDIISEFQKDKNVYHGYNERPMEKQALKAISTLTGEFHKHYPEPKDNTSVQRQWLPYSDKALHFAQKNIDSNIEKNKVSGIQVTNPMQTYKVNMQQTLPYDIATSLPLGEGDRAIQRKYNNAGEFRHIRSDITRVMNNPITKK